MGGILPTKRLVNLASKVFEDNNQKLKNKKLDWPWRDGREGTVYTRPER